MGRYRILNSSFKNAEKTSKKAPQSSQTKKKQASETERTDKQRHRGLKRRTKGWSHPRKFGSGEKKTRSRTASRRRAYCSEQGNRTDKEMERCHPTTAYDGRHGLKKKKNEGAEIEQEES